jgi:hypothetical protein
MPKKIPEVIDDLTPLDQPQLEKEVEDLKEKLRETKTRRNFVQQERVPIAYNYLGNDCFLL